MAGCQRSGCPIDSASAREAGLYVLISLSGSDHLPPNLFCLSPSWLAVAATPAAPPSPALWTNRLRKSPTQAAATAANVAAMVSVLVLFVVCTAICVF